MIMKATVVCSILLFLHTSGFSMCPSPCICTQYRHGGLHVDCSSRFLKNVYMPLPENTVSLSFQNNMLTNIHSGRLDKLNHIQTLNLSQNPWSCDCNIAYLKHWMEDNPNVVVTGATCQSPLHCQRMPIIQLTGNEFASCGGRQHVDCQGFFANTVIMMSLMLLIIILVAWAASVSKGLACQVATNPYISEADLPMGSRVRLASS